MTGSIVALPGVSRCFGNVTAPLGLIDVLRLADLEDLAGRRVEHLSGGQRQRLRLAELAAAALADGESPLSPRERQVLETSASGAPISEVAARLHLSEGTVRNYRSAAIGKTGARNRTEAFGVAREKGWI